MTKNMMIVGVGGQGTLLASRILGQVLMNSGFDVKVSEVHGMSQRGGSVVTYVRYGEKVDSPIFDKGSADIILAFERLEAIRYVSYLKKGGIIIANDQRIDPMPVVTGVMEYPENIFEKIEQKGINLKSINALKLAKEAGSTKAVNVVLIGLMAKKWDFPKEDWLLALEQTVPQKFLEMNKKAFELGYTA